MPKHRPFPPRGVGSGFFNKREWARNRFFPGGKRGAKEGQTENKCEFCSLFLGPPRGFPFFVFRFDFLWGFGRGIQIFPRKKLLAMFSHRGQFTLSKGKQKRDFPAGGGALEISGSLGLGLGCHSMGAVFFFFFFFFLLREITEEPTRILKRGGLCFLGRP
eukprot:FR735129.1.p3 GENE.FR735129.1~~FR735129.1.p3  ORF type:complete len:161 (-),score=59.19 FR735129.1:653-1135(-)